MKEATELLMRSAIYGAGSLGTVLGAWMSEAGIPVDLINRNRAHVEALRNRGATITGTVEKRVPVNALLPEEMTGTYDIIFLMTKQLENRRVVSSLQPFLSDRGVIVSLQNGIPEPGIADIIGPERTLGCVVEWGATMNAPGCSILTSDPDSLSFHMGRMDGVPQDMFDAVRSQLESMCPVVVEENLMGARWSKLLINATFSGLGTVIGGRFGDVSEGKIARKLAVRCMNEVIAVGQAAGVRFAPVQGKNITALFHYRTPVKRAFGEAILPLAMKKHRLIEPSMLQDLRKGKPCEVDAINGIVCEWGKREGVLTPINDRIVRLIHEQQEGRRPLSADNLQAMMDLL